MEYQKRLKFIEYIKKNFIDTNPNCKRYKGFYFKNYDDFSSIEMVFFENLDLAIKYYNKYRYEEFGACLFTIDRQNTPNLAFEDTFLIYHININILKCECTVNDLKEDLRSNGRTIEDELKALVRLLNGEEPPQRIFNC